MKRTHLHLVDSWESEYARRAVLPLGWYLTVVGIGAAFGASVTALVFFLVRRCP